VTLLKANASHAGTPINGYYITSDVARNGALGKGKNDMIALVVRFLLLLGGAIAGWFFEKDQPNFSVIQMAIAVLLLVFFVFVIGFWPRKWRRRFSPHKTKME
jgi:hypothetical protein